MSRTIDLHLIKNFCCSTLPPTLIQNLDFCLGPRQWHRAATRDAVCKGNPSLFNPGMHFVRDSISLHIPYLSHPCTPTVKVGGKAAGTQSSSITDLGCYSFLPWAPLGLEKDTSWKQSTYRQDFSQSKPYFLVHRSWLSLLSLLPTPTASACGLRSHHLKNSSAHLLHSSTAPRGRTPDGGDKSTRSWLLARVFLLN